MQESDEYTWRLPGKSITPSFNPDIIEFNTFPFPLFEEELSG